MTMLGIFDSFLDDHMGMDSDLKDGDKLDLLSASIQESGLFGEQSEVCRVKSTPYGAHKLLLGYADKAI
jgi:hypothetical protein